MTSVGVRPSAASQAAKRVVETERKAVGHIPRGWAVVKPLVKRGWIRSRRATWTGSSRVVLRARPRVRRIDAAAAPGFGAVNKVLFSASLRALACEYEPRPGVALTPGTTAPTWPKTINPVNISYATGIFVLSCPANMTFTVTA